MRLEVEDEFYGRYGAKSIYEYNDKGEFFRSIDYNEDGVLIRGLDCILQAPNESGNWTRRVCSQIIGIDADGKSQVSNERVQVIIRTFTYY